MVRVERYDICKEKVWNEFNHESKNSLFMYDRSYMDYHKDRFIDHSLMFYDDDKLIAILPLTENGTELRSHGGLTYGGFIVGETMKQSLMLECFATLKLYCQKKNFNKIIYKVIPHIYHSQPAEEDKYALYINKASILKIEASTVINLNCPLPMAKLRTRQIKKGKKNNVIIKQEVDFEAYKKYINLLNEVLNNRHDVNAVHTAEEIFMLFERFPQNIHLYCAYYNNEVVAGTILFEYSGVIHTQYLASNEIGRSIGALDCVIEYVINQYVSTKKYLDFGISTEDMGTYLNEGLISQKEGFGGRSVVYETWEIGVVKEQKD